MKFIFTPLIIFIISNILFILSCDEITDNKVLNTETSIAITKAHGSSGYEQYKIWLTKLDSNIIIYDLYSLQLDSVLEIMKIVDGLLISGGPDLNPSLYNYDSMAWICEPPDNYRDSLETLSIDYAYKNKLAILGICRGQQMLNVYFGGSLITDIPLQHKSNIKHRGDTSKAFHTINIETNSFLSHFSQNNTVLVNSSHHQAVEKLGNKLTIYAYSNDSIVEAIGLLDKSYPSFFLGVQFHPEHLINNEFALSIGKEFVESAINHSKKQLKI